MAEAWEAFVHKAIAGEPDDPFTRMLRQRLASGHRIVRIDLEPKAEASTYRVVLERLRELSEVRVPHSSHFTRWSLQAGIRMESIEAEGRRFALLVAERYQPIVDELGADYTNALLLDRVRSLAPPRTLVRITNERPNHLAPGREQLRAVKLLDTMLTSLAGDLGGSLHYSEEEVAEILDMALERFVRERFHKDSRGLLSTG